MREAPTQAIRDDRDGVLIRLRAQPGASRNEIVPCPDGILKIRVTATAVEGAANRALIKLLSKALSVPKSSIAVRSGKTSREKVLFVEGLSADEVERRLARHPMRLAP